MQLGQAAELAGALVGREEQAAALLRRLHRPTARRFVLAGAIYVTGVARALAYAVRRVVVNRVVRSGDRWLKRRVAGSTPIIATGNAYLRRAGRFSMLATARSWARHEVDGDVA